MKKYLTISILTLVTLFICTRAFCFDSALADKYQAQVRGINGSEYFPAVKEAIQKAEKSINISMFIMEVSLDKVNSKVNQLVGALIDAKNRGVDVEVIFDQNVDFVQQDYSSEAKIRSIRAYKRLKEAGIKVHYDEPIKYAHAKTIVIDKKIVILGSTNWTESSFDKSIETNVLVESEGLAGEVLDYLKTIKIDSGIEEYIDNTQPSTPVSFEFMTNPGLAPLMVKAQDERAFDVYLYILHGTPERQETKLPEQKDTSAQITLNYEEMAKYLGIYEGWDSKAYRRQIIKVLRKLEKKYKLVKFEPSYGKDGRVTIEDSVERIADSLWYGVQSTEYGGKKENKIACLAGRQEAPTNQEEGESAFVSDELPVDSLRRTSHYVSNDLDYFELPDDYFEFGWNRELSFRAKICYFINLACADISDTKPFWSKSVATITKQFGGVSKDIINNGMGELRRKKLIDVKYDEITGKPYEERMPKMYKILKLYNPKELEVKLNEIEKKYGKESYARAKVYAKIVFEENNPEVIEDIILKTKEYGDKKVKEAFKIVSLKSVDNPKRVYNYAVGIIVKTDDRVQKTEKR